MKDIDYTKLITKSCANCADLIVCYQEENKTPEKICKNWTISYPAFEKLCLEGKINLNEVME